MDRDEARQLLQQVQRGDLSVNQALQAFSQLGIEDLGYAKIDHHRSLRKGFPEVVYAAGKTPEQVAGIVERLQVRNDRVLITRADQATYQRVKEVSPTAVYHQLAKAITVVKEQSAPRYSGYVAAVSAGTSDMPVAEEAVVTLEVMGHEVHRIYDVGVAGIHRLLAQQDEISGANVVIVVAGMEGALASVVGGLTDRPVIAVPTSVGYGANLGGIAPLLTMLNSCASGVTVVNIDNGFGAGYSAALINALICEEGGR